jgi:hypothetical protein
LSAASACWPAGEGERELAVALSISGAVSLGSSCQQASRRERRWERTSALRRWTRAAATGGPLARRSGQSTAGQACSRLRTSSEGRAAWSNAETSSPTEPVVIHHGREEQAQQPPCLPRSARGPAEIPPFPLETSDAQTKRGTPTARRPMRCSCQSKTPANPDPASNPDPARARPMVDHATGTISISISISHRKKIPNLCSLANVPALSCERQREREARPTSSSASTPCWAAG